MSHRAVSWALDRNDLKPAPWIVLIQLADRHNKDTLRCDPCQALLATDCNMHRASVNRHLETLVQAGLIWRIPREHPTSGKHLSTFYVLGLNFAKPPFIEHATVPVGPPVAKDQNTNAAINRVANCDMETVSQIGPEPCRNFGDIRVANCDTNLVTKPVTKPCASEAEPQTPQMDDLFLDKFMAAFPRIGSLVETEAALENAIASGVDPDAILAGARAYALEQKGNAPRYVAYSENWLGDRRWEKHAPKAADPDCVSSVEQSWISAFTGGNGTLARHCPPAVVSSLLAAGHVTLEQCRALEVRV
jgi:hypothetical protein